MNEMKSKIEALLFVWSEPLSITDISEAIGEDIKTTRRYLNELMDEYDVQMRGFQLKKIGDTYQLQTRKIHFEFLKKTFTVTKRPKKLNTSTLETLAIIAYNQPVTRIEIEEIRGVKSMSSIETLLDRQLIMECGRLEKIGKPKLYKTTDEFLRYFDLESIDYLPNITEIEKRLEERYEN